MRKYESFRVQALLMITGGNRFRRCGIVKYRIGKEILHVRFRSGLPQRATGFWFNINPNTLNNTTHEVWICGRPDVYHLVPIEIVQMMYDDPGAYPDRAHAEIKVMTVIPCRQMVQYAPGKSLDLVPYFKGRLKAGRSAAGP